MHTIDDGLLEHFLALFNGFVARFKHGDSRDQSLIQLKQDHTRRVLQNAVAIAGDVITDDQFLFDTAVLSALFHDIGRFPQYQQYKTFNDRLSIDHGRLGVVTLKSEKILAELSPKQQRLILAAVSLHNNKRLPASLPQELRLICNIVRDSDKLDIFPVMLDHFSSGGTDKTITLELDHHPTKYTPSFFEKVLNNQECSYTEMRWTNDFKLMLAHWVYQLNFAMSYVLFEQQGSFNRLFDLLPSDEPMLLLKQSLTRVMIDRKTQLATATV